MSLQVAMKNGSRHHNPGVECQLRWTFEVKRIHKIFIYLSTNQIHRNTCIYTYHQVHTYCTSRYVYIYIYISLSIPSGHLVRGRCKRPSCALGGGSGGNKVPRGCIFNVFQGVSEKLLVYFQGGVVTLMRWVANGSKQKLPMHKSWQRQRFIGNQDCKRSSKHCRCTEKHVPSDSCKLARQIATTRRSCLGWREEKVPFEAMANQAAWYIYIYILYIRATPRLCPGVAA